MRFLLNNSKNLIDGLNNDFYSLPVFREKIGIFAVE